MQLHLILSQVEPQTVTLPSVCPHPGCGSTEFRLHQQVSKSLRDALHQTVVVYRYRCLHCGRTFRVYPQGVTHAHTSQQVQHLAVLLHFLGLSLGAVSSALDVLGIYLSKSRVYAAVQDAKIGNPNLARRMVFKAIQQRHYYRPGLYVRTMEQWLPLSLMTDGYYGLVVLVASLSETDIAGLQGQITPLMVSMGGQVKLVDASNRDNGCDRPEQYAL